MNRQTIGARGEALAAAALEEAGYRIVRQNYRKRSGEIDIIAWDGDTLCFIEVKARSSVRYGQPAEAVNWTKRRRIAQTAELYLQESGLDNVPCRFDVAEVLNDEVRLIKGAFDGTEA